MGRSGKFRFSYIGLFFLSTFLSLSFLFAELAEARTVALESGHGHVCALNDNNEMHCWGWNHFGQTARDDIDTRTPKPYKIPLPPGRIERIAAGGQNACAVVEGELYCWGKNNTGQLANRTGLNSHIPTRIELPGTIGMVDIGDNHICAIVDGGLMCWGWNFSCEIGQQGCVGGNDNPTRVHWEPKWVHSMGPGSGVTFLDASKGHNCVIKNGGAYCWGASVYGILGDGIRRTDPQPTPKAVIGMSSGVTEIAGGEYSTCAIRRGKIYCWGRGLYYGIDDYYRVETSPMRMPGMPGNNYSGLVNYEENTCVKQGSKPLCFGNGGIGALGHGVAEFSVPAVQPDSLSSVISLTVGSFSGCALSSDAVHCWGYNAFCQGGTGQCNFGNLVPNKVMNLP